MNDTDLLALNVYREAAGEPDEGRAAVARVVKNRMAAKFFSDGTIRGTVLRKDQFSWAYFAFVDKVGGTITPGKHVQVYSRIASTLPEAEAVAEDLLKRVVPNVFRHCSEIAQSVMAGTYYSPLYAKLGNDAVSYLNPRILTRPPTWATTARFVVSIGHHDFYRATDKPINPGALVA